MGKIIITIQSADRSFRRDLETPDDLTVRAFAGFLADLLEAELPDAGPAVRQFTLTKNGREPEADQTLAAAGIIGGDILVLE